MRKLTLIVFACLLVFALSLVTPLAAQESTLEPTTETPITEPPPVVVDPPLVIDQTSTFNTALVVIGAIVVIVFGVFGYIMKPAVAGAVAGMPQWAAEMLLTAGDTGLSALEKYTETTPDPIDDTEVAKLRKAYDELREEIYKLRQAQTPLPVTHVGELTAQTGVGDNVVTTTTTTTTVDEPAG